MRLLYSNILPLRLEEGQQTFIDYFNEAAANSDSLEIAVGYVSKASLMELQKIVEDNRINNVCLNIGMYYLEGMPEGTYHAAVSLNEAWKQAGIGEVRVIKAFKYHGKLYTFYKKRLPIAGIIGSNNLGAIKLEASNLRQYEVSAVTEIPEEIEEISNIISKLKDPNCSANIQEIEIPLIREVNRALVDQEYVTKVTSDELDAFKRNTTDISFEIPLKVPANHTDPKMRGSNINVCYASGRKRVWWEVEIVVGKEIRDLPGYPEHQVPFMAVTDDGWKFKVWTCGQNNKNLYSKDDLKIMGRWIKGRLVASGLVESVNQVETDTEYKGMITGEMLEKYGRNSITLTKTTLKTITEDGTEMDVWMLSFLPINADTQEETY
ncbi:restriction endonuclease PLD domain-containing protein [Paenibacillus lactis]|uniref:restriction endonuclease PLD domain-containing protein n=1 Tax=Paenibacillus lactis TaxID=228574 RepID=UPI00048B1EA0|nr:restriction endonuclease PLD domain-containing protein [Paenibacillus lactis]MCM3494724.1 NgoFVII family restriction endonuclease [Paenibacillus lactis]GIO91415.1 restriction endonuclease [Paenibacillus lactis]